MLPVLGVKFWIEMGMVLLNKLRTTVIIMFDLIFQGDVQRVNRYIETGGNVNMYSYGVTPLHLAAQMGYEEIVRVLLDAGAHVNAEDSCKRCTPVMYASAFGKISLVRLLIDAGANWRHQSKDGETVLSGACFWGRLDMVKFWIKMGADVNHPMTGFRKSVLAMAICRGHYKMVKVLLNAGAKMDTDVLVMFIKERRMLKESSD